jgi:hypothetical protein
VRRVLVVTFALALGMVAASSGCPCAPPIYASAGAPWGLDRIELPASDAQVRAVLDRTPVAVSGVPRVREQSCGSLWRAVSYGRSEDVNGGIGAELLGAGRPDPVAYLADRRLSSQRDVLPEGERDFVLEAQCVDPDADLVYLIYNVCTGTEGVCIGRERSYRIDFAAPEADRVFHIGAETPELRRALVEAFVRTVDAMPVDYA